MQTFLSDVWSAIQNNTAWVLFFLIVVIFLLVYRRDFPSLIRHTKRVKIPGGFEVEFYEDLNQAHKLAEKAASEVAAAETEKPLSATIVATSSVEEDLTVTSLRDVTTGEDVVNAILDEARTEPKLALVRLSIAIESEIRRLLARSGHLVGRTYIPLPRAVEIIRTHARNIRCSPKLC